MKTRIAALLTSIALAGMAGPAAAEEYPDTNTSIKDKSGDAGAPNQDVTESL